MDGLPQLKSKSCLIKIPNNGLKILHEFQQNISWAVGFATAFFYKISNQSFLYEIEKQHLLFIFSEIQKFKNQVNWTKVDNRGLHN